MTVLMFQATKHFSSCATPPLVSCILIIYFVTVVTSHFIQCANFFPAGEVVACGELEGLVSGE